MFQLQALFLKQIEVTALQANDLKSEMTS